MRRSPRHRRPPTVGLLIETGAPGGAERMIISLAEKLRERGHRVVPVVAHDERRGRWLFDAFAGRGFAPETFRVRSPYDWRLLWHLARLLWRRGVDVVHSHEFYMAVCGGICAALLALPHVITMHGGRYYAERPLRVRALRWIARRSNAIVGVSAATARDLEKTLRLGADVVRRVDNGIRFEAGDRESVRRELDLAPGDVLISSVGRLQPEKGHATMVRALGELHRAGGLPSWRAVIAGSGPGEPTVRVLAQESELGERLQLLGFRDDVASIHAATDVFVLPSLSEGLPLALLEAMHAGAAIVASDVGGVPEAVTHGESALLVPPSDPHALAAALRELLADPGKRRRLGDAGQRLVHARHGIGPMVDAYERLYERER